MAEYTPTVPGDQDASIEELTSPASSNSERIAVIRTSDRINFKRCRRRWGWQSHLKGNLNPKTTFGALWFGSGIHYALEDYHGRNIYLHPREAFLAYVQASAAIKDVDLPADFVDLVPLGEGMMNYYADYWLKQRDPLTTFMHNGVPQVEVNATVQIDMSIFPRWLKRNYDQVFYSATFDRVVVDRDDRLWILDYKTAKRIETRHYQTDPQIGAYCWLGNHLYGRPIAGMIYMQFRKDVPHQPKLLANGALSVSKTQLTTHALYREAVVKLYGNNTSSWPEQYRVFLDSLAFEETTETDHFIRRDYVLRNTISHQSEGEKIIMEIEDMLDPTLPLYPNPTRDCSWCPFMNACISIDDGSDWQHELETQFTQRPQTRDSWRKYLPTTGIAGMAHQQAVVDLLQL